MATQEQMTLPEIIKSFNSILGDFLQQISPLIGTSYHHYFTNLIKYNSLLPIQYFIHYVHDPNKSLEQQILNRDEHYFTDITNIKEKHNDHLQDAKGYEDTALMEIIRLQGVYSKLSKESKDNVWDILLTLLYLSNQYMELKNLKKRTN